MAYQSDNTAVLGGGCFWCLEAMFQQLRGIRAVVPGYAGGTVPDPSYEQVCNGHTGHAEVVRVEFDPAVITYDDLLRVFFVMHDPTTPNRQGADVGTQYRSIIVANTLLQQEIAENIRAEIDQARIWMDPIVTQIVPGSVFFPAEAYHMNYFIKNPDAGYCRAVVAPKVTHFRKIFLKRVV